MAQHLLSAATDRGQKCLLLRFRGSKASE